jgi:hypothetical protein
MGRKKVAKRKAVQRRNDEGGYDTVFETVFEWVSDESGSCSSDSGSSDSSSSCD